MSFEVGPLFAMAAAPEGGSPWLQFVPFAIVLAIFYFIILLPMKRKQAKVQEFLDALKVGDRIVSVTWTIEIKAGASSQVSFVAKNPTKGSAITWKVHQKYSDGMSSDWTGAPGTKTPAPVTTLVAGTRP
jgi:preprotein translocase YajC subunit